jgi:hypothetical protein
MVTKQCSLSECVEDFDESAVVLNAGAQEFVWSLFCAVKTVKERMHLVIWLSVVDIWGLCWVPNGSNDGIERSESLKPLTLWALPIVRYSK